MGFSGGDLGSAALGYGLDAATFIPGLGELASGFKNSKKLAKIAPWIIKTFGAGMSALGVTSAVPALEKAAKGEYLTMDDYRAITNGLMGVVGFKNTFSKSGNVNGTSSQNQVTLEMQNGKSAPTNYYAQATTGDYQSPESLSLLNKAIRDKKATIAKNAVLAGDSKGYQNQVFKPNPLQGTATTSLEDLMLINRVGADKVQFQNGMLVWPQKKLSSDKVN